MRKIIVSNFLTLDGLYDGKDKNIGSLYEYYHPDYYDDDSFDFYNAELLRASDFLLLSRNSFLGNKEYWTGVPNDPTATDIRRELAGLFQSIEKLVISDKLTEAELVPWENTHHHQTRGCLSKYLCPQTGIWQGHFDPHEPPALERPAGS